MDPNQRMQHHSSPPNQQHYQNDRVIPPNQLHEQQIKRQRLENEKPYNPNAMNRMMMDNTNMPRHQMLTHAQMQQPMQNRQIPQQFPGQAMHHQMALQQQQQQQPIKNMMHEGQAQIPMQSPMQVHNQPRNVHHQIPPHEIKQNRPQVLHGHQRTFIPPGQNQAQQMVSQLVHHQAGDMMQHQQQQILLQQKLQQEAKAAQHARLNASRIQQQQEMQKHKEQIDFGVDSEIWLGSARKIIEEVKVSSSKSVGLRHWNVPSGKSYAVNKVINRGLVGLNTERKEASQQKDSEPITDPTLRPHEILLVQSGARPKTELYLTGRLDYSEEVLSDLLKFLSSVSDQIVGTQIYREQCFRTETKENEKMKLLSSGSISKNEFWLRFSYGTLSPSTPAKTKFSSSPSITILRTFNNNSFDDSDDCYPVSSRIVTELRLTQKKALSLLESGKIVDSTDRKYKLVSDSQNGFIVVIEFKFNPGTVDQVTLLVETYHRDFTSNVPSTNSIIVTAIRKMENETSSEHAIISLMEVASKLQEKIQLNKI